MFFLLKIIRWLLKGIAGLALFVVLYFLSAFVLSSITTNHSLTTDETTTAIYIKSNGVHTDIVVPVTHANLDWRDTFDVNTFEKVDSTFEYIAFGWGDKGFFLETPTWADLKISTALKAAFFMSSTAMHVNYLANEPKADENCKQIYVSKKVYLQLCQEITKSFSRKEQHIQLIQHPGYTDTDNFYEAEGTYSFIKTCNVWTGECLRHSGIQVGYWTPFDWNVLGSLAEYPNTVQ